MGSALLAVDIFGPLSDAVTKATLPIIDSFLLGWVTAAMKFIGFVFTFVDNSATFNISTNFGDGGSALGSLWPMMLWLGMSIAVVLFFWQVGSAVIRADHSGLVLALTGVVKYALIVVAIITVTETVNELCDVLSTSILGLMGANSFGDAGKGLLGDNSVITQASAAGMASVMFLLGLLSIVGGVLLWLEFAMRQVAVLALVATAPIAAAGLISGGTQSWFRKTARWTAALLLAKPAIALMLVISAKLLTDHQGINGLVGGFAALMLAVFVPFAMLRLVSFVDSGSAGAGAGGAVVAGGAGALAAGSGWVSSKAGGSSGGGDGGGDSAGGGASSATETGAANRLLAATGPVGGGINTVAGTAEKVGQPLTEHLDNMGIGEGGSGSAFQDAAEQRQNRQFGEQPGQTPAEPQSAVPHTPEPPTPTVPETGSSTGPTGSGGADGGAGSGGTLTATEAAEVVVLV